MKTWQKTIGLLIANIILLSIFLFAEQAYVKSHLSTNDIKDRFSLVDNYQFASTEVPLELSFRTQDRWLDSISLIFINIDNLDEGHLLVDICENGKVVAKAEVPLSEIEAGEWTEIKIGEKLSKNKTYTMVISSDDCNTHPYLITVNGDFQIVENQELYDYDGQTLLISYTYGEDVHWIAKFIILCTVFLMDVYLAARLYKKNLLIQQKVNVNFWGIKSVSVTQLLCLILLFALYVIVHIYKISQFSVGINEDEMGMGYDAWCLANFGCDRFLNSWPVYLNNYGSGQSILYCYLCVPFVKLFGLSATVLRIPAMLSAFVLLFYGGKIVSRKWKGNVNNLILYLGLITILPYFLYSSRVGLDCNLSLAAMTVFIYYFEVMLETRSKKHLLLTGLTAGITLYSYALTWIALPFIFLFALPYCLYTKKLNLKEIVIMAIPLGILASPLLLFNVVNWLRLDPVKIGPITIYRIDNYQNQYTLRHAGEKLSLIFRYVFLEGSELYPVGRPLYWISIPFAVVGMVHSYSCAVRAIKRKEVNIEMFMLLWLLAEVFVGCILNKAPVTWRINAIFFPVFWFLLDGIIFVASYKWAGKKLAMGVVFLIYFIQSTQFVNNYFSSKTYTGLFFWSLDEVAEYFDDHFSEEERQRQTYIYTNDNWVMYTYWFSANRWDPREHIVDSSTRYETENIRFDAPGELDLSGIYVIDGQYIDKVRELKENGFSLQRLAHYWIGVIE